MKALGPPPALAVVLAVLAVAGACDPPVEQEARPRRAFAPMPAPSQAARGRLVDGERVERVVTWPGAETRDERTRARLSPAARAAVDGSPVPVLAPAGPEWRDPWITSPRGPKGPGFGYALSVATPGRTLALHGSRTATLVPGIGRHAGRERLRGGRGFVTDNDGVKSATWIEHGVAYALDLECADPQARGCDLAALRAEVEALVYVGGAGHGQGNESARGGVL